MSGEAAQHEAHSACVFKQTEEQMCFKHVECEYELKEVNSVISTSLFKKACFILTPASRSLQLMEETST